ncbi:hypothetical protein K0M31_019618 [Melipona bicolor]|uniref:Secreted protein n=1 Tax=Melipona bicolor TaxID=60889 RepID=A0AA40G3M4_9HYME|nr:hypothetical protein K0M31_019618 [Melipona bicolor]
MLMFLSMFALTYILQSPILESTGRPRSASFKKPSGPASSERELPENVPVRSRSNPEHRQPVRERVLSSRASARCTNKFLAFQRWPKLPRGQHLDENVTFVITHSVTSEECARIRSPSCIARDNSHIVECVV